MSQFTLHSARSDGRTLVLQITSESLTGVHELRVDGFSRLTLLSCVLNSMRMEGSEETLATAAKTCMAMLGRARFR